MSSDALRAPCPGCQKTLRIPPEKANRTVRCKNCGTRFNPQSTATPTSEEIIPSGDLGVVVRLPETKRQPKGKRRLIAAALLLALGIGVGFALLPKTASDTSGDSSANSNRTKEAATEGVPADQVAPDFPRRALAISVSNYLYARQVNGGLDSRNLHALMSRLGRFLHVPVDQFGLLTDVAAPAAPKSPNQKKPVPPPAPIVPPVKKAVESTIASFLESSRPQDRILLFWIGHLTELDNTAYLVPLDGELNAKETLIPLTWVFDRLRACKARQKILILDACRSKPGQGQETQATGPLGTKTAELLANPPAGIQVLSASASGQFSYEDEDGGVFLKKLQDSLTQKILKKKIQEPQDPLPVEELAQAVAKSTTAAVSENWQAQQTPRLSGKEATIDIATETDGSQPPKVVVGLLDKNDSGMAGAKEVASIFREITLPPLGLEKNQVAPPPIETLVSFDARTLALYRGDEAPQTLVADYTAKHPLRAAVLDAVSQLRRSFATGNDAFSIQEVYAGGNREKLKAEIAGMQSKPAGIYEKLNEALTNLEQIEEDRKSEPSRRWQAHFDYLHAELLIRIAFVYEYDLMLGKIRTDSLPMPEGFTPSGWRLAPQENLQSGKEMREKRAQALKILDKIIKEHSGTPWAVLAKRDRIQTLGLRWEPYRERMLEHQP
jgi:hypothetical protein